IDLDARNFPNGHRLELPRQMPHVRRDDETPARHLAPHHFCIESLTPRHHPHRVRDLARSGGAHLRAVCTHFRLRYVGFLELRSPPNSGKRPPHLLRPPFTLPISPFPQATPVGASPLLVAFPRKPTHHITQSLLREIEPQQH